MKIDRCGWEGRLEIEATEISLKVKFLKELLHSGDLTNIGKYQIHLLKVQLKVMQDYEDILKERLDDINRKKSTVIDESKTYTVKEFEKQFKDYSIYQLYKWSIPIYMIKHNNKFYWSVMLEIKEYEKYENYGTNFFLRSISEQLYEELVKLPDSARICEISFPDSLRRIEMSC